MWVAANGAGAFGNRPDYYVTNTILNCDFLIDVPVAKVHSYGGITACLKNFVGTAPRVRAAELYFQDKIHGKRPAGQWTWDGGVDRYLESGEGFRFGPAAS